MVSFVIQRTFFIQIFFAFFHQAQGFHYPTFYAENMCPAGHPSSYVLHVGYQDIVSYAGILKSNKGGGTIQSNIDCHITLQAPVGLKLLVEVKKCDFNSEHSDYIRINGHTYLADCKPGFENSSSNSLDIYYKTDGASYKGFNGFKLYFTIFSEADSNGRCNQSTPFNFLCKNHRCIWGALECDGFNNCEDFTDEKNCMNVGLKIWITIGVLAVLTLLGFLGYLCFVQCSRRRRKRDPLLRRRQNPPEPSLQSSPPSLYPPYQGYQKF